MVSRGLGLGEPCAERRVAPGVLAMMLACGFADGDPIVTGSASSGALDTTTTADASITTLTGTDGTATGGSADTDLPPPCACVDRQPGDRCLRVINECEAPIHAGASGDEQPPGALDAVSTLAPQECVAVTVREVVGGRVWGGTACDGDACLGDGNAGRGSLIQLALADDGTDVYDVSLVDGFNVPIAMVPVATAGGGEPCRAASCAADLSVVCPEPLQREDAEGELAWCASACQACGDCDGCVDCAATAEPACMACDGLGDLCCTGTGCEANELTALWKSLCPDAITFRGDEGARTCGTRPDYDLVFCP